jgi:single-strand DNA-binding protein
MGSGLNKVILIGNLGKDPSARDLDGGNLVASFPLATSEYFKDRNGNRDEKTEWHNIVLWRTLAEYAVKNLKKGNTIMIEGKLRTRSWEDKVGVKHYITEIVGDHIINLTQKKDPIGESGNRSADFQKPEVKPETGGIGLNDGTGDLS